MSATDQNELSLPPHGDVVCFGFLTYLLLLVVETLPEKNDGARIQEIVESLGDDAAIIASILSSWNVPTTLVSSPVGDDYHGSKVIERLQASGIDNVNRIRQGATTPLEVAIVDATGSRTYFQRRDPLAMASLPSLDSDQLGQARMLYVDWYDGPQVINAMKTARACGIPVFLNIESRYYNNPDLQELLRYTNICQVSLDEPGASGNPAQIARVLIDQGAGTVLVTLGAGGCVIVQPNQSFHIQSPGIKVVDGYGAGAAFAAGVIYGLQAGWPLEVWARFANAHAALKCGITGNPAMAISQVQELAERLDVRSLAL